MTRSSGQLVTTITRDVECDGTVTRTFLSLHSIPPLTLSWSCTFVGEVDVTVDPEAQWAGWDCPSCDTQHEIAWDEVSGRG